MIPVGSRVQIRAICKDDAFCTGPGAKARFQGQKGTVVNEPLKFNPLNATFKGSIRFDSLPPCNEPYELYFASIQVKKLKED